MCEPEKIEYEGSAIYVTDAMGREVFWLDAGRPESTDE
jgi:hypothetical protein